MHTSVGVAPDPPAVPLPVEIGALANSPVRKAHDPLALLLAVAICSRGFHVVVFVDAGFGEASRPVRHAAHARPGPVHGHVGMIVIVPNVTSRLTADFLPAFDVVVARVVAFQFGAFRAEVGKVQDPVPRGARSCRLPRWRLRSRFPAGGRQNLGLIPGQIPGRLQPLRLLPLPNRRSGPRAEHAIRRTGLEAERREPPLNSNTVVTRQTLVARFQLPRRRAAFRDREDSVASGPCARLPAGPGAQRTDELATIPAAVLGGLHGARFRLVLCYRALALGPAVAVHRERAATVPYPCQRGTVRASGSGACIERRRFRLVPGAVVPREPVGRFPRLPGMTEGDRAVGDLGMRRSGGDNQRGGGDRHAAGLGRAEPAGYDPVREVRPAPAAEPPARPLRARRRRSEPVALADQVGACAVALKPLHDLIAAYVMAADRLHGDDTPVPMLARAKCATGRARVYVRDDRPFGGAVPLLARPLRRSADGYQRSARRLVLPFAPPAEREGVPPATSRN